uniref:TonB-dependent receptor n=1 Tax=Roseihalotalea indica TaxID=2867963 RepID=A0AA49GQX3_9BACT|nr:TonB-dependent receptor [Tunicatimonas sp. TK19036]
MSKQILPRLQLHYAGFFLLSFLISMGTAIAQTTTVSGTVTDELNEGLPGVNIIVKGTSQGTISDIEGKYTLSEISSSDTLLFSSVGYAPQEVPVGGQSTIDISMQEDIQSLSEIVVTGYATERKVDVTGAVAVVDLEPIKNTSSGNPMQALQGRVAGLFVEKSGTPTGENSRILIRGVNTLGNNSPLYIIDGVPTKEARIFQSLNPSTIESVQILKDASAASIYGSRASNGVIIVTTRDGSQSGENVSVTFNSSISMQTTRPQWQDMLNSEERGIALWRGSVNDRTDPGVHSAIYTYDWNNDFDNPVLNSVTIQPFMNGDQNVPVGNTDWQDAAYETGYVTSNDLTLTANTENSGLLANVGYVKNTGTLVYTDYERYSARLNANTSAFNKKLRLGVNSLLATSNQTLAANDLGGAPTPFLAITLPPTIPVRTADGEFAGPLGAGYSDRNNPVDMQWLNRWDNLNRTSIFGNVYAEVEPIENLVFRTNYGIEYSNDVNKNIELAFQEGFLGRSVNSLQRATGRRLDRVWSNTLTYEIELGEHRINLLGGVEAIWQDFQEFGAFREGFAEQTEDYFTLSAGTGRSTNFGNATGGRLLAQFGKVNYAFSDKYLASVTIRRDGSSRFGEDNQYGIFPAATLGWRIVNESFMQDATFLSDLKLRAGYGEVGNQDIGDVARFALYEPRYGNIQGNWTNIGTAYDLNGNDSGGLPSGFVSVQGGNPDLKWETTREFNIGVDFGFLDDRIIGYIDYFTRETSDILLQPPIASAVGEGKLRWVNGAVVENKGLEIALTYRGNIGDDLSYSINGNFSRFRDKITELPEEVRTAFPGNSEKTILGQSQFSYFGYKTDGLFQNEAEVDAHAEQIGAAPGRIRYVDLNDDGVINALDQDYLGTVLPGFEYGIRVDLNYKNFDFSLFGSGVGGRTGNDQFIPFNSFVNVGANMGTGVLDAWTPQNPGSDTPKLSLIDANSEGRASNFYLVNSSYFKLRNIQLGYSLPLSSIESLHMQQLRVFLMGENLFWFKSKEFQGADPEISNAGGDPWNQIPVPTSITFGVNVTFN